MSILLGDLEFGTEGRLLTGCDYVLCFMPGFKSWMFMSDELSTNVC